MTAVHLSQKIRNELVFRTLQVVDVQQLTPAMRRITLGGAELAGFDSPSVDDHVKLFFPNAAGRLVRPARAPDGTVEDTGEVPSPMRDYTPRLHDRDAGTLAIDFVLHGDGPAATWAAQAAIGQTLGLGGPRGSFVVAQDFDRYVLLGDETALPAIGRWIEGIGHAATPPSAAIVALIEIADDRERQALHAPAHVDITWLPRKGADAATCTLLEGALRALPDIAGDTFYWIGAESRRARGMRLYLSDERGIEKEWIRASGYWSRGTSGEE